MSDADERELKMTSQPTLLGEEALDLADLLSTVLDKGVVVHGDVTIAVADVDLIRLNLGLLLAAVASTDRRGPASATRSMAASLGPILVPQSAAPRRMQKDGGPLGEPPSETAPEVSLNSVAQGLPERINADADGVESGLARLVLTLIEVLRKVLEHQAVRRMEGGRLSEEEVERLGLALSRLDSRMQDLKRVFGLSDEDLQIDLGPLGRLR